MNRAVYVSIVGALVALALASNAGSSDQAPRVRIGTYDNRAIAVAFAPSRFNPVGQKMAELEQAKKAGDRARAGELEAWGEKHQRQLHRQAFARVPVDDLLLSVKNRLPEIAKERGLDAIAWWCDHASAGVEVVDVTDDLVLLFEPSERTLKTVRELCEQAPAELDVIEAGHDH
jgi:hypothetical protein